VSSPGTAIESVSLPESPYFSLRVVNGFPCRTCVRKGALFFRACSALDPQTVSLRHTPPCLSGVRPALFPLSSFFESSRLRWGPRRAFRALFWPSQFCPFPKDGRGFVGPVFRETALQTVSLFFGSFPFFFWRGVVLRPGQAVVRRTRVYLRLARPSLSAFFSPRKVRQKAPRTYSHPSFFPQWSTFWIRAGRSYPWLLFLTN